MLIFIKADYLAQFEKFMGSLAKGPTGRAEGGMDGFHAIDARRIRA